MFTRIESSSPFLCSFKTLFTKPSAYEALALKPDFADAWNNLGFAYLKKGETERAQEEVKFLKSIRSELGNVLEKKIEEKQPTP